MNNIDDLLAFFKKHETDTDNDIESTAFGNFKHKYSMSFIKDQLKTYRKESFGYCELSKKEAADKCDLVFIEMKSGFHIAVDASYLDQEDDFELKLPTGEVFKSKFTK